MENLPELEENPQIYDLMINELYYNSQLCPLCGQDELVIEGRCTTCMNCGWSLCEV